MRKKNNKIIILVITLIVLLVAGLIFFLNYSKDDYSFSYLENKWINDNSSKVIDVAIYNDVPIFGESGQGIAFSFLDNFTKEYKIQFNKLSYLASNTSSTQEVAFKIVNYDQELGKDDILIYEDNYVLIGKTDQTIDRPTDINNKKIGVLNSDITAVSNYLTGATNTAYQPYNSFNDMVTAYNEEVIDYMAVPLNLYLSSILANDDQNISYHISEMTNKYVLSINNNNSLKNILKKYYNQFQENKYYDLYKEYFLELFFDKKEIVEQNKISYASKVYTYGYVENPPYESVKNNKFVGTLANYINSFADLVDIDIHFEKYKSITELQNALISGEVDMAFGNFNTDALASSISKTPSLFKEEYVVLTNNNLVVNSVKSLSNIEVNTIAGSKLYDYLTNNNVKTKSYLDSSSMLRNSNSTSTVVMDIGTYNYYKSSRLSNYNVVYTGVLNNDYNFVIKNTNDNNTIGQLLSYFVTTINYKTVEYNYQSSVEKATSLTFFKYLFLVLFILIVVALIVMAIIRKKKKNPTIKKEERLKFIDMMTSLKNRNYLNYSIAKWDKNVIYPQAIIIIDLNNIKYINDNHGHSKGDEVIKMAASILIVNQYENSDIVRTDGNEFLVYMVGYDERHVATYTRKIYKELRELPYGFGASIGYSMINDEIKTIDDAINEATQEMRSSKEKK